LVAKDNKRYRKIYEQIKCVTKDEESERGTSREVETKWDTGETMSISNSGLYHKVTISSWEKCNPSSLW